MKTIKRYALALSLLAVGLSAAKATQLASPTFIMNGGQLMVTVDNWGVAPVGVQVLLVDTNNASNRMRVISANENIRLDPLHDTASNFFVDLAECRYRVVVVTTNPTNGFEEIKVTLQARDLNGNEVLFTDSMTEVNINLSSIGYSR